MLETITKDFSNIGIDLGAALFVLPVRTASEEVEVMLKVHTTKFGNVALLCVEGKIVCGETDALRNAVLTQADVSVVLLNLARVNTIDAGGLGVMLELREETESKEIEFRLEQVKRLIAIPFSRRISSW